MDASSPIPTGLARVHTHEEVSLITHTSTLVRSHMSSPHFDASHDFAHVQRVLALASHILEVERFVPGSRYDRSTVQLAALLHDVDDRKYAVAAAAADDGASRGGDDRGGGKATARKMLLELECPAILAYNVQAVVDCVSYSKECSDPRRVRDTLRSHPELAIVQDADRLDALGAVGIARAFTYGGARDNARGLEGTLQHFDEKLLGLQGMMKTQEGKRLAGIRTERLKQFKEWWDDETKPTVHREVQEKHYPFRSNAYIMALIFIGTGLLLSLIVPVGPFFRHL
ncbi:MAG: hypothetical protein LQ346_007994 [Caloplaca aetnensis]|nr:MAG: hypothetical protein LQ346_007994 [Caloplaca aetnensis]